MVGVRPEGASHGCRILRIHFSMSLHTQGLERSEYYTSSVEEILIGWYFFESAAAGDFLTKSVHSTTVCPAMKIPTTNKPTAAPTPPPAVSLFVLEANSLLSDPSFEQGTWATTPRTNGFTRDGFARDGSSGNVSTEHIHSGSFSILKSRGTDSIAPDQN